jgi:hypothetical protein
MKISHVCLVVATLFISCTGEALAKGVYKYGSWQIGAGGNLIAGVGNADCSTQPGPILVLWQSYDGTDACVTVTNTGRTDFDVDLTDSSGNVKEMTVAVGNTGAICVADAQSADIRNGFPNCSAVWHVDHFQPTPP